MFKRILSVIVSLVLAMSIFMAVEYTNHLIFPFPDGMDLKDREALAEFVRKSQSILILPLIGWTLGSFVAGWTVTKISKQETITLPLIIGSVLTLLGSMNFLMIPHPLWFVILGMSTFMPMTLVGNFIARKKD